MSKVDTKAANESLLAKVKDARKTGWDGKHKDLLESFKPKEHRLKKKLRSLGVTDAILGAWLNRTATQANYFLNGVYSPPHADEVKMEALIRVLEESKKGD